MKDNLFAQKTIHYILTHPNCRKRKIKSIVKFLAWQFYKRLTHRYLDFKLTPDVKIRCYPDSKSASAALYCGLYDYDEMNFLLRYLRPADSFLDLGANVGVYTLLAASKINAGTIYSFEALPKNYQRLVENLKINSFEQVKPYSLAISDRSGTITFEIADGDSTARITTTEVATAITVPTDTLDHLLQNQLIANLTLGKIDIEGAELLALKGATWLLENQRPRVWIIELLDADNELEYEPKEVVDFLNGYEYNLYWYDAYDNQLQSISLDQKSGNNLLAIADESVKFVRDRLSSAAAQTIN
ncbi:MAG: FkbM family methyltransferase [Xenococcaceae cyanobacterium]